MSEVFVRDAVRWAEQHFRSAGIESARLDAELLAAWVLGVERISILLMPHRTLTSDEDQRFRMATARRAAREPIAYITGEKEFWSLSFMVTRDTLIPRPDSESLIEIASRTLAFDPPRRILDLGTGTGCLLLAALTEFPDATGLGVDASMAAIAVAMQNGHRHALAGRAVWEQGNWDDAIEAEQRFDLILANPPYVALADRDQLMPDVRDYEPASALFAGEDGLEALRALMPVFMRRLNPGAVALVEIGIGQGEAASALAQSAGLAVRLHPPLGLDEGVHVGDLQRDVLRPRRRIGIADHRRRARQLEEGEDVAAARIEEDVHIGIGLLGGGHPILRHGPDQVHAEDTLVEVDRLLRILAAKSDVVELLDPHRLLLAAACRWCRCCADPLSHKTRWC